MLVYASFLLIDIGCELQLSSCRQAIGYMLDVFHTSRCLTLEVALLMPDRRSILAGWIPKQEQLIFS